MRQPDSILADALELPNSERARLALRLTESLEVAPEEDSEDAWAREIARRIELLRQGTARTVTAHAALADARARLARRA